jgi:hypothetical protein
MPGSGGDTIPWTPHYITWGNIVPVHAMKDRGEEGVYLYSFLTLALKGGEWSISGPSHLTPGKEPTDK